MTSISDATRKAIVALTKPEPTPLAPISERPFRPPVLSSALRRELDHALAGPTVLPGSGNGDAAINLHPVLDWQPDAADAAEQFRDGMAHPASREVVEGWLATLAMMVANAPRDQAAVEMQCAAVWRLCGQLPAAVWSDESVDAYCDVEKYWPCPAELRQFLRAREALIERQIAGLDAIARAPRRAPAARASTAYLDGLLAAGTASVPPEGPAEDKPTTEAVKAAAIEADAADPIQADDPATVKKRLVAVYGEAVFATDLLADRLDALQRRGPKP